MREGEKIPAFDAKNQDGQNVKIDPNSLEGPIVIYFYPKDDTPGCTKEACSFRDSHEAFSDAGVSVYGVSSDSVSSHKKFQEKYQLPFDLLSDTDKKLRKQFEVPTNLLGLLPGRVTYVVNAEGVVVKVFNSQMNAEKHVKESLEAVKEFAR